MQQTQETLSFSTSGEGFFDITARVNHWIAQSGINTGLLTLFIQHTSASLTIQENADPEVMEDLGDFLSHIAPKEPKIYRHTMEGADDMPAHIRTSLTDISLSIPVFGGKMTLGTWQGVYLCEHRARGHIRHIVLHLIGE